jgi:saccharopine dehydrogenase-like NADP-dependent oxidoreductase
MVGAGAVGTVSALKFKQLAMLEQLVIADSIPENAELLARRLKDPRVTSLGLDAGDRAAVARALVHTGSTLLLNAALPATNMTVMGACLDAGCHYIDMASAGTDDDGLPKMADQFALDTDFRARGRMALLGMGADPGTTNVYAAFAARHLLDEVTEIRVRDGDNSTCQGHDGFIAAFSPWVLIDECLCKAVSYRDGEFRLEEPLTGCEPFNFPELGSLPCYYVDHEEAKTLPRFFPRARVIDFKLCMDEMTLSTLRVIQQLGLSRIDKLQVGNVEVAPRDVVVSLLPQPRDLAGRMRGKTCVGTLVKGLKHGIERAFYIYNVADHEIAFAELGVQATAYQTGIPPVVAAELISSGVWSGTGVLSPEQLHPDPFLARLSQLGMPWHVRDDSDPRVRSSSLVKDGEKPVRPRTVVAA